MTASIWQTWRRRASAWLLELFEDRSYRAGMATALRSRARGEAKQLMPSRTWENAQVNVSDWPTPVTSVVLPRWIAGYEAGLRAPYTVREDDNEDTTREHVEELDLHECDIDHDTVTDITLTSLARPKSPLRLRTTALQAFGLHRRRFAHDAR